jgi:hypothetical protein
MAITPRARIQRFFGKTFNAPRRNQIRARLLKKQCARAEAQLSRSVPMQL